MNGMLSKARGFVGLALAVTLGVMILGTPPQSAHVGYFIAKSINGHSQVLDVIGEGMGGYGGGAIGAEAGAEWGAGIGWIGGPLGALAGGLIGAGAGAL